MAINVADNFSYKGGKPLDARVKYSTIAEMVAVPAADLYDGCMAYVTATKLNYQYDSSNDTDETLGKWREFETGGGGHEILDVEDTALTQREKLKFGNGLTASDNSTDEQTEVEVDIMSSEDMDDVVTPLPSVGARYHKYSTEEQVVGKWIDGSTLYEKTAQVTLPAITDGTFGQIEWDIASLNVNEIISLKYLVRQSSNSQWTDGFYMSGDGYVVKALHVNDVTHNNYAIRVLSNSSSYSNGKCYITIQYTKTTD